MNKKRKEKMEDDSSGSFSRNNLILPENYEAALSFGQMNDQDAALSFVQMNDHDAAAAAWTLLHMKRQHLCSDFANALQELIDKNHIQACVVPPKVRTSFPKESKSTANHLQEELTGKNNIQTACVVPPPPKVVRVSFPKESRSTANHLQELTGKNNKQNCVVPPEVLASFPEEISRRHLVGQYSTSCLTKELTISDIKSNQMRLMFPKHFVEKDIYPLLKEGESPKNGIPTTLYFVNPKTKQDRYEFPMTYKSWGEDKTHVLTSGWLTLVNECKINVGETIKLWAFRHSLSGDLRHSCHSLYGNLCFAATLRLSDALL